MQVRAWFLEFSAEPWRSLFAIAVVGTLFSALLDALAILPSFCGGSAGLVRALGLSGALSLVFATNPPASLVFAWIFMLIAMMPPLVAHQIRHIYRASIPARRIRAVVIFCASYLCVWTVVGIVLMAGATLLRLIASENFSSFFLALALALAWTATPLHQIALNNCHRVRRIGVFGVAADRDTLVYGFASGVWCVASCWAWMLVPLVTDTGHVAAMLAVSVTLLVERLMRPRMPCWRISPVMALAMTFGRNAITRAV